jgi:hypothetical protein
VGKGLVALEVHVLAARSFVLLRVGELDQARVAADAETALAGRLDDPGLLEMAARDRVLVALADGDFPLSAGLLAEGLAEGAPVSRPLTRLARAEALARGGELGQAESELRATVLEPVRVSDFPETLVPPLSDLRFEWRLEPLNGGDGTPITVDVDIPAAEAARLDGQQDTIRASLSNLVELADRS